ncbi:MAG: hypothetical protein E7650_03760 [Ruminococcaceae bacterium]|nr:hypothetical protein [Oscillospiraceae bacterium]MBQ2757555.1 RecX family transcriptional regulator [Clostridia bacterium]
MTINEKIMLCAVRAADGGARLLLDVTRGEGEDKRRETLCVFAARLGYVPVCGTVSPDTYAEFVHEASVCEAVTLGLRLLSYSGVSRARLIEKMRVRGVSAATAREAADLLASEGYLDETESALAAMRGDLAKLWGDKRILQDLAAKGYRGAALEGVKEMLRGENAAKRCAKLIKKRHMELPQEEEDIARFAAVLMRYGYTVREIKQALEEIAEF